MLGPDKQIIHQYSFAGKNAHEHLIEHLLEQEETWIENLLNTKEEMIMSKKKNLIITKLHIVIFVLKNFQTPF
jgi:hypothetical protein